MKVLLVEDSVLIRNRLTELLSDIEGIDVVGQTDSAGKAIDSIFRLTPDIVILDIHLREGDGIQVLRCAKRDQGYPIFIVLTSFPYPLYRQRTLAAGANHFLDKTTEFDHVPDLIRQIQFAAQQPLGCSGLHSDRTDVAE